MLTTWFIASKQELAERFRLRSKRQARDPFTNGPITLVGPNYEANVFDGLASFEIDALDLEVVAALFEVDALEAIDDTRYEGGSDLAQTLPRLPALYGVPDWAVAVFRTADRAKRAETLVELVEKERWYAGYETTFSDDFPNRERFLELRARPPDAVTELVETFGMLLEGAPSGSSLFGFAWE